MKNVVKPQRDHRIQFVATHLGFDQRQYDSGRGQQRNSNVMMAIV